MYFFAKGSYLFSIYTCRFIKSYGGAIFSFCFLESRIIMLYVFDVPNTFINCRSFNCYYTVSPTLARVLGALLNTRMQRALLHLNYLQREYCTLFVMICLFRVKSVSTSSRVRRGHGILIYHPATQTGLSITYYRVLILLHYSFAYFS